MALSAEATAAIELRSMQGKAAIVTGSSSGVGAAVALLLAEHGCDVVVNYSRSAGPAEAVAEACRKHGVRVVLCQADVGTDVGCEALVLAAVQGLGRIDFLVNNAGVTQFVQHQNLDGLTTADFERIYNVNAIGAFRMIRCCAPHMRKQGGGRVVNMSSIAGAYQTVGSSVAYLMSKAALNALTASLGKALGPEIVVNAVCPGFIQGEWLKQGMGEQAYNFVQYAAHWVSWILNPAGMGEQAYNFVQSAMEQRTPLRATSTPKTVASTVVWLLEGATMMTGQALVIDGGMGLMRGPLG